MARSAAARAPKAPNKAETPEAATETPAVTEYAAVIAAMQVELTRLGTEFAALTLRVARMDHDMQNDRAAAEMGDAADENDVRRRLARVERMAGIRGEG